MRAGLYGAMLRGFFQRCPRCGSGAMFGRFLTVNAQCPSCGLELHHQRADDAPPYFTILIVGHIVVPLLLMLEQRAAPPSWVHMVVWMPVILVLSLWLLPRVKGALIGLQWHAGMHGFGGHPD
jgi:uncharacterized protein (DUF983 family)